MKKLRDIGAASHKKEFVLIDESLEQNRQALSTQKRHFFDRIHLFCPVSWKILWNEIILRANTFFLSKILQAHQSWSIYNASGLKLEMIRRSYESFNISLFRLGIHGQPWNSEVPSMVDTILGGNCFPFSLFFFLFSFRFAWSNLNNLAW